MPKNVFLWLWLNHLKEEIYISEGHMSESRKIMAIMNFDVIIVLITCVVYTFVNNCLFWHRLGTCKFFRLISVSIIRFPTLNTLCKFWGSSTLINQIDYIFSYKIFTMGKIWVIQFELIEDDTIQSEDPQIWTE